MSYWLSSPMQNWSFIPMQDGPAIRSFCAAQKHDHGVLGDAFLSNGTWSSSWDSSSPPYSGTLDEESNSLVDSFINTSLFGEQVTDDPNPAQQNFCCTNYDADEPCGEVIDSSMDCLGMPPLPLPSITSTGCNVEAQAISNGLELVHLLVTCAEAVACRDKCFAASALDRIWSLANPCGDSLQRISFCFATGLSLRLSLLRNTNPNGSVNSGAVVEDHCIDREARMEGFHLLYQTTPYVAFGFMAANDAICQAAQGKDYLHIVDLGMEHTLQWPPLIRTLASRPQGPPRLLRITGVVSATASADAVEHGKKLLVSDASALGFPVEFRTLPELSSPPFFSAEELEMRAGEALFVNSVLHLHTYVKESRGSLKVVLAAIKKLRPGLVTVVEQDSNHNGPFFLGRFLESLHYYSVIFDALEANLPRRSLQRTKIERWHFMEEICNIVAHEGAERVERHERAEQWRRQLGRAGFQVVGLRSMSQARLLLSIYGCEGYTLASEKGCLTLGWKGRPMLWASAWQVNSS